MSSENKTGQITFKDERIRKLVEEWTSYQGWQISDFEILLKLINVSLPVELDSFNNGNHNVLICHQENSNEDIYIKLSNGKPPKRISTATVIRGNNTKIYRTKKKQKQSSVPQADLRCAIINEGEKTVLFLLYHGSPYAIKSHEGNEEIYISILTNHWVYRDENMKIEYDGENQKHFITLNSDKVSLDDIALLKKIRAANNKINSLIKQKI